MPHDDRTSLPPDGHDFGRLHLQPPPDLPDEWGEPPAIDPDDRTTRTSRLLGGAFALVLLLIAGLLVGSALSVWVPGAFGDERGTLAVSARVAAPDERPSALGPRRMLRCIEITPDAWRCETRPRRRTSEDDER